MKKSLLCMFLIFAACFSMTGCSSGKPADERPESITLRIATPPIGLGSVPGVGEAEISEMMEVAAERFSAQYTAFDVNFEINRYNYTGEKEQLLDTIGTEDAADIFYAGSYGFPVYAVNRIDKRIACADDSVAQDLPQLRPIQRGQESAQRADGNREF